MCKFAASMSNVCFSFHIFCSFFSALYLSSCVVVCFSQNQNQLLLLLLFYLSYPMLSIVCFFLNNYCTVRGKTHRKGGLLNQQAHKTITTQSTLMNALLAPKKRGAHTHKPRHSHSLFQFKI